MIRISYKEVSDKAEDFILTMRMISYPHTNYDDQDADTKMAGGTPEVRSDKSLTSMTFNIRHSTNEPMDQWTKSPMDQ